MPIETLEVDQHTIQPSHDTIFGLVVDTQHKLLCFIWCLLCLSIKQNIAKFKNSTISIVVYLVQYENKTKDRVHKLKNLDTMPKSFITVHFDQRVQIFLLFFIFDFFLFFPICPCLSSLSRSHLPSFQLRSRSRSGSRPPEYPSLSS